MGTQTLGGFCPDSLLTAFMAPPIGNWSGRRKILKVFHPIARYTPFLRPPMSVIRESGSPITSPLYSAVKHAGAFYCRHCWKGVSIKLTPFRRRRRSFSISWKVPNLPTHNAPFLEIFFNRKSIPPHMCVKNSTAFRRERCYRWMEGSLFTDF